MLEEEEILFEFAKYIKITEIKYMALKITTKMILLV